jgi:flagella basal body P-ring formation protein FlgA
MRPLKAIAALILILLGALSFAILPGAALAAPVELRQDVVVSNGRVTLGDLFAQAGPAAGVLVARVQPGQTAVLDATQVQLLARSNGVDWGNFAGLRRITVQAAAPEPRPEAKAAARGPQVLAYTHSLNTGDIVQAQDLAWSREAVAGADAPRDPDAVIGMAVRRPLREGDAVSLRDISAPMVIKRDDVISVTFAMNGLSLTLQAKALSDAAAGQNLSVINPVSRKIVQAVATAPGQAVVGPGPIRSRPPPAFPPPVNPWPCVEVRHALVPTLSPGRPGPDPALSGGLRGDP